ncbi:hypothetical protein HYU95_03070 [Candidatus Daviesbacteria bacterium]|nr:hypothetical protein [Candidatus Daviesbacteria bacterium]
MVEEINTKHLGLDIGTKNTRGAIVTETGNVIFLVTVPITTNPAAATRDLLDMLQARVPFAEIASAGVTGRGRELYDGREGWEVFTSPYASIAGLREEKPGTIIEIGGQSSRVTEPGNQEGKAWRFTHSPLCASGSGQFLEQQAGRMGISIEEYGQEALAWTEEPPRVATRCSVFAKSDLIHLQQKGWTKSAMLSGLADGIARMVNAQWKDDFIARVYFIGGVAANQAVVRALEKVLGQPVTVPENYDYRGAIGAAILPINKSSAPTDFYRQNEVSLNLDYVPQKLYPIYLTNEWKPKELEPGVTEVYMGVDVGSTSTKIVLINDRGEVVTKRYIMTAGQPLDAIKQIMADPEIASLEDKYKVMSVGVTGSGRYLVSEAIGGDLVKNEITAQTRAAKHINPRVTTVFELGGQDSKYVYLEHGTVLDYQMNKACAAGTGSFIDELAEQIQLPTKTGEFARQAFAAKQQLNLGEKCTAFMGQAVAEAQQGGATKGEIAAGLASSLVENYLSKVVGSRRIGGEIFLTGAVFYNEAVVAAFQAALPDHKFTVPEHKEVTGAIGAALLAKEARKEGESSKFKGISNVATAEIKLNYFNCNGCEQFCSISVLNGEKGRRRFYGSRCDRYDAEEVGGKKRERPATPFTTREELLFEGYNPEKGDKNKPIIGIPRALMAYDLAPMITGFLNALGLRIRYTSATTKRNIEDGISRGNTDSCFPLKLLHGHVEELLRGKGEEKVSYVLIPSPVHMGKKEYEGDERFACPLVQAAPSIIKSVYKLGDRLLDPVIDFSRGDEVVIESLIDIAKRLGFNEKEGKEAAMAGLVEQREFENKLQERGKKLIDELADDPDAIGVVLLSRAYNAQDSGANLGMTDELAKLGVNPIPMDYLPLDTIDIRDITRRPYWNYERRILAASKIIAGNPNLFGVFLSNFGCGPNSFIQNMVEDVMGKKPLGQLELDEHAAEAGYITRIEALVDTIKSFQQAGIQLENDPKRYARQIYTGMSAGANVVISYMSDHVPVVAAAMQHFGVNAIPLQKSCEESLALSRGITNGKECLPFRDSTGAAILAYDRGELPNDAWFLMAGSNGPCRLGKYSPEQQRIFDELKMPLKALTTVSNNNYGDLGLDYKFELLAWQGIVATDQLQRLRWRTRPYEKSGQKGQVDQAYEEYLQKIAQSIRENKDNGLERVMREAKAVFEDLRDSTLESRPLVGINGEIYLRANEFCNKDLGKACEARGLEVVVAPMGEWIDYVNLRRTEEAWSNFMDHLRSASLRDPEEIKEAAKKLVMPFVRGLALNWYRNKITSWANGHHKEPNPAQLIKVSSRYLPSDHGRNGSEAVLSIGDGVLQLLDKRFAGVISVGPHGCMPGNIVSAFVEQISKELGNKPWISLSYDGSRENVNNERIATFAEQIHSRKLQAVH